MINAVGHMPEMNNAPDRQGLTFVHVSGAEVSRGLPEAGITDARQDPADLSRIRKPNPLQSYQRSALSSAGVVFSEPTSLAVEAPTPTDAASVDIKQLAARGILLAYAIILTDGKDFRTGLKNAWGTRVQQMRHDYTERELVHAYFRRDGARKRDAELARQGQNAERDRASLQAWQNEQFRNLRAVIERDFRRESTSADGEVSDAQRLQEVRRQSYERSRVLYGQLAQYQDRAATHLDRRHARDNMHIQIEAAVGLAMRIEHHNARRRMANPHYVPRFVQRVLDWAAQSA